MRVRRLSISNFREVSTGAVDFTGHTLLVGGNNVGKSTVCEALDLVLGPERLFRRPVVDEHDFHVAAHAAGIEFIGDPVADWKTARRLLQDIPALAELFREVRLVRLFRASDALASGLGTRWLEVEQLSGCK